MNSLSSSRSRTGSAIAKATTSAIAATHPNLADKIVRCVLDAHETLADMASLAPSPSVNSAFQDLVACCTVIPEPDPHDGEDKVVAE